MSRALGRVLPGGEYHLLNDLLLPDGKGGQPRVDHGMVSVYGVFVIETKNWDGRVYGKADDQTWTVIYGRRRKE